jgi:hypothetical protein
MIAQPMGQTWLWASMAERMQREDAAYFQAFWSRPGYVGHDLPQLVERDILDLRVTVARTLLAKDIVQSREFQGSEYNQLRGLAGLFSGMQGNAELAMAIELNDVPETGYRLGAGLKFLSGEAAGRQLYCISTGGKLFLCDGEGEASNLRFSGVRSGDQVHLDNRAFLAYCYYYRHHLLPAAEYDCLRLNGRPIYEQHEPLEMSPFMGVQHTGKFEGKLMWVHHTHDASLWPMQGIGMKNNVERVNGAEAAKKMFRLRWTENAEHVPPMMAASPANRANTTWLINYQPVIEQCLADLAAWVEHGIEPTGTNFEIRDGAVILPSTAAKRGGIQPVVAVTANGGSRTEVGTGEWVNLQVHAEVPAGAGTIISVKWDFDGSGTYPESAPVDGKSADVTLATRHRFDRPGTYFVTALVESHRNGDVNATSRRIPNVASARVVAK